MNKTIFTLLLTLLINFEGWAQEASPGGQGQEGPAIRATYKNIGVEAFDKMRQHGTNVVLDVRTKKEFQEGHIPGAVLIDFNRPDFEEQLRKLDKSKTYLVHCAVGGRSAKACKKMEEMKFQRVYNLEGGMRAWEKAGKVVEEVK